jgi:shikimate kinase
VTERVLLVGMMGAGKTTVGSRLAERLGWQLLDSDAEVERRTGRRVPEIFAADGEACFRAEESLVLARAVTSDTPVVVSVAGGAVLDGDNRRRIRHGGTVVWLRCRPDVLARRVGGGEGRPLLGDDPGASLRRLDSQRRPLYAEVADLVIDVDTLRSGEIVDRITTFLGSRDGDRACEGLRR